MLYIINANAFALIIPSSPSACLAMDGRMARNPCDHRTGSSALFRFGSGFGLPLRFGWQDVSCVCSGYEAEASQTGHPWKGGQGELAASKLVAYFRKHGIRITTS